MTPVEVHLIEAIEERDADAVRTMIGQQTFVVIGILDQDDEDAEPSTLRAEVGDFEALVAFTSDAKASAFVQEMDEVFEENDEVEGMFVEGQALLELLAGGLGLLLNPESESAAVIDPKLAKQVADS